MLRAFSSSSKRIAVLLGRQHGLMVELARDFINSLLKAQKKPSPVDLPFSSGLSSNLGGGLADHVLSLRTQNINIKLLQLPLSHSPGVDKWWKEDLLLLQGPRSPGIASRTHALHLPVCLPDSGTWCPTLGFLPPGSQKLSQCFPEGVFSLSPGGRLSQNEMKQEAVGAFSTQ